MPIHLISQNTAALKELFCDKRCRHSLKGNANIPWLMKSTMRRFLQVGQTIAVGEASLLALTLSRKVRTPESMAPDNVREGVTFRFRATETNRLYIL